MSMLTRLGRSSKTNLEFKANSSDDINPFANDASSVVESIRPRHSEMSISSRHNGVLAPLNNYPPRAGIPPTGKLYTNIFFSMKSHYGESKLIGEGSYSNVYKVCQKGKTFDDSDACTYALKVFKLGGPIYQYKKMIHRTIRSGKMGLLEGLKEINLLRLGKQMPFQLRLFEAHFTGGTFYLLTDYCVGDLRALMVSRAATTFVRFPAKEAIFVLAPIIKAIAFLHQKGYVHRDVKLDNVLVSELGIPKLGDFGSAIKVPSKGKMSFSSFGTDAYLAPELHFGEAYSSNIDTWSLGLCFYELIFSSFDSVAARDDKKMLEKLTTDFTQQVIDDRYKIGSERIENPFTAIPDDDWPWVRNLLNRMLVLDPAGRVELETILAESELSWPLEHWQEYVETGNFSEIEAARRFAYLAKFSMETMHFYDKIVRKFKVNTSIPSDRTTIGRKTSINVVKHQSSFEELV